MPWQPPSPTEALAKSRLGLTPCQNTRPPAHDQSRRAKEPATSRTMYQYRLLWESGHSPFEYLVLNNNLSETLPDTEAARQP